MDWELGNHSSADLKRVFLSTKWVHVLSGHKTYSLSHSISGLLDGVSRIPKYASLFAGGGVLVGLPTPESGLGAGCISPAYFSSF